MTMLRLDAVGLGVLTGYAADRLFGDPTTHHPVAWFGSFAGHVEERVWAPRRARGAGFLVGVVSGPVLAATMMSRVPTTSRTGAVARWATTAITTWAALGGRSLEREALAVHDLLGDDDLGGARFRIRSLVGRDTSTAGSNELARATVESLAENQSDAVAATLVWGCLLGAPGVVLHRCANTLDAMVGHHTLRHEEFGWAAARLDDVLNVLPAWASVVATAVATGTFGGAREVVRVVRRDAPVHPSPNAGPVEAAAAAALGVRLGGINAYGGVSENRGELGHGRPVVVADIPRAVRLTRRTGRLVLTGCLLARSLVRHARS